MKSISLVSKPRKEYAIGSKSKGTRSNIVTEFNKEVIKQILLGNRVLLPGDITIEIIKHEKYTVFGKTKQEPRFGFNYKVKISYEKLKRKKVKFTPSTSLNNKLKTVLENTDFEYRLVSNGYK